ncbi:PH domain-containing protein [Alteromonas sp. ASW11-130]|uniref:PH domain-containing protein n=1 Tax=Alteromonas sp. ASW11-130 TaxID=3015775 RepID=UPI002241BA2F|nr:PH domain-containing protein [Alteromonas sp. ASW11-130]MCW8092655.1 PH domain-containing protein [Alteromonas sp. ASW11-130]
MGLLDTLMGNASETSIEEVREELSPILADTEQVIKAYKLVRDLVIFTSGRVMFIDKQGLTGRKVNYHSIPYRAITQFVVESAGHFDMDSELTVWVSGQDAPLKIELSKNAAPGVQKALAEKLFG